MKAARRRVAPENPGHRRVEDDDVIRKLTIDLVRTVVGLPWPQQFELVRRLGLAPVPAGPERGEKAGDDLPADLLALLATVVRDASWIQDYALGPLIWRPIAKALRLALIQLASHYFPEAARLRPPEDTPDPDPSLTIEVHHFLNGARLADADLAHADLAGAYLADADLAHADLTGADLTGATLTGAILAHADLTGADLTGAYLADADLAHATLTGADLTGATLTGAYLADADLAHADLAGATLTRAILARAVLDGAYLTDAALAGAYLADADLAHADLTGADLTGADLAGATLTSVRNPGPRPRGAILTDAIGLPQGWAPAPKNGGEEETAGESRESTEG